MRLLGTLSNLQSLHLPTVPLQEGQLADRCQPLSSACSLAAPHSGLSTFPVPVREGFYRWASALRKEKAPRTDSFIVTEIQKGSDPWVDMDPLCTGDVRSRARRGLCHCYAQIMLCCFALPYLSVSYFVRFFLFPCRFVSRQRLERKRSRRKRATACKIRPLGSFPGGYASPSAQMKPAPGSRQRTPVWHIASRKSPRKDKTQSAPGICLDLSRFSWDQP